MVAKGFVCGAVLLSVSVLSVSGQNKVGTIEFFGGKGLDLPALRQSLPVHPGVPDDRLGQLAWSGTVEQILARGTKP